MELNHPVAVNIINVPVLDFLREGAFQSVLRKLSLPSGGFQPHRSWKISLVNHSLCSFFESAVGCKTKSFVVEALTLPEFKAVNPSQNSLDYSWNQDS